MRTRRMGPGLRLTALHPAVVAFLTHRGLTLAAWERRAGLSRCALWRVLAGRRQCPRLVTAERLARAAGVSVSTVAALIAHARQEGDDRVRRWREGEAARLEALAR